MNLKERFIDFEMKLTAFIEVGNDGLFAICTDSNPICMISGFGDGVKEAMEDFQECHMEVKTFGRKKERNYLSLNLRSVMIPLAS